MGKAPNIQIPPKEYEAKIDAFFTACEASKVEHPLKRGGVMVRYAMIPTTVGLANWLGMGSTSLYYQILNGNMSTEWYGLHPEHPITQAFTGKDGKFNEEECALEYKRILACAQSRIEETILTLALNADIDSRVAGLILTKHGYKEETENETTHTVILKGDKGDIERMSR